MKTQPAANHLLYRPRDIPSIAAAVVAPAARHGATRAGKLRMSQFPHG